MAKGEKVNKQNAEQGEMGEHVMAIVQPGSKSFRFVIAK